MTASSSGATADRPRVLVTQRIPEPALERLRAFAEVTLPPSPDRIPERAELVALLREHAYALVLLTDRVDADLLAASSGLRIVANMAVGYDNVDVAAATARGVMVTNTPGVLTETTADLAWALILAVARRIVEADRYVRAGKWTHWGPLLMLGTDVHGKTLGIVGLGRIGQAVARRAQGFGMRVLYHSRHPVPAEVEQALGARYVALADLLRESDFVSIHCPYNASTHHLIDGTALARMRPTAYLVNTARGPIVDETALVDALWTGRLAGAGLDVFEGEPAVRPGLLDLDSVVLLPHIGSASLETRARMALMAAENIVAAIEGRRPPNLVNPEVLSR
ncbi:MAG: D-glycerate dehydrogenase [Chloroflexi bacterium]|nr:D-glycerate dehydrogenase [Chloroflexota bacterium]